jgi:hypothetical protein
MKLKLGRWPKMLNRILAAALLVILSCGPLAEVQQTYVAPDLLAGSLPGFVDEFYSHCPTNSKPQVIALVHRLPEGNGSSPTAVARATYVSDKGEGMVFFLLDYFLKASDNQRRFLVAHELLHASFGVEHDSGVLMRGDGITVQEANQLTWVDVEKYCK